MAQQSFTPALGRAEWTGLYDVTIALMTREGRWRKALVEQIAPKGGDLIVDVGCGTGSLLLALHRRAHRARLMGVDPDREVLARASAKARRRGAEIDFRLGCASDAASLQIKTADKAVSSLVFHQTPVEEKRAGLAAMYALLRPGGELHVADYGFQRTPLMRRQFKIVQRLDGFEHTEPNALGILPELMQGCGFAAVTETRIFPTPTGSISLYRAFRPR